MNGQTRTCATCRRERPVSLFPRRNQRRCEPCREKAVSQSWCRQCRVPLPLRPNGAPRNLCDSPDCRHALAQRAGAAGVAAKKARFARRKTKRCPQCGKHKRRTPEYFAISHRAPDGTIRKLDYICKPCRAALQRERYRSDPDRRARTLARAKAQREQILARAAVDEQFAAEWHERRRAWDAARRERLRRPAEPEARVFEFVGRLPAAPLAAAIDRACRDSGDLIAVCDRAGVTDRTVLAWRTGERRWVRLDVADRVLVELDLLWWDAWNEDTVRRPVLAVGLYRPHPRNRRDGTRIVQWETGWRGYGDAGPDHKMLAAVERVWDGDREASAA